MHKKCNCLNSTHTNQVFENILRKIDTKKYSIQVHLISKKSIASPAISGGGVDGGGEGGLRSIGGQQCSEEEAMESVSDGEFVFSWIPPLEKESEGLSKEN